MAVVDYWFSDVGAGTESGTSWANRAPLVVSGGWNPIISTFNMASDSLRARIEGPKTYTFTTALASLTNMGVGRGLILAGCDSSGDLLPIPWGWDAAAGEWDHSNIPYLRSAGTNRVITPQVYSAQMIGFESAGAIGFPNSPASVTFALFCRVLMKSGTGISTYGLQVRRAFGCLGKVDGATQWAALFALEAGAGNDVRNCRFEAPVGSAGNRRLIMSLGGGGARINVQNCVCIGGNEGIWWDTGSPNGGNQGIIANNVIYSPGAAAGGNGIMLEDSVAAATELLCANNVVVGYVNGINGNGGPSAVVNNRCRDNTTAQIVAPAAGAPYFENITDAGTDADEFVNAAGGDFRIKNSCSWVDRGIGVSREPAAGSSNPQRVCTF